MKFIKNILSVALLCTVGSVNPRVARTTKPVGSIPTRVTTTPPPVIQQRPQPVAQPQSYAQALHIIKTQMPSHKVLSNNAFTQEFVNFVKSLNLSDIETKALLEAGANIHATWTDNDEINKNILLSLKNNIQTIMQIKSKEQFQPQPQIHPIKKDIPIKPIEPVRQHKPIIIQKPIAQPKPIIPQQPVKKSELIEAPMKEHAATNNLVMTLDPGKAETVQNLASGAMVTQAIITLYEKAAPLILTSNILEIILRIKQIVGDVNLQRLRMVIGTAQKMQHAEMLLQSQHLQTISSIALIFLCDIDFDSKNLNCYFHKSEKLVLLIPKEYIRSNIPEAINFNLTDQAKVCGFNPTVLNAIPEVTMDALTKQLQLQQSIPSRKDQFISNLTSMFTIQKKAIRLGTAKEEDVTPETTPWIIYLTGHGSAPQQFHLRIEGKTHKSISAGQIAGISAQAFSQLMKFFDKNLDVKYMHYMTCFGGGFNRTFINEVLSSLEVDFIVSSEGIDESGVRNETEIRWDNRRNKLTLTSLSFTEFFRLLKLFFTQPEQFVKIKGKAQDPILFILRNINPGTLQESQAFVRFPATDKFVAADIGQKTEVLTQTIVRAHEIEKRTIDFSNKNIDTLIINTPRINVPLNLGKKIGNSHTAIVFPSPQSFNPSYEAIYLFSEIMSEDTLQSFIFNCIYHNARLYTQSFVIKKLTNILYQQSGLPNKQIPITNMLIQIKNVFVNRAVLGAMGGTIQIAFEYDGNIYQSLFTTQTFDTDQLYRNIQNITFTTTPVASTNMNILANQFVIAANIPKITKPITLESLVEFFDDKIDQQDPSMAVWSDANLADLKKFVEQRTTSPQKQPARPQPIIRQPKQAIGRRMRQ